MNGPWHLDGALLGAALGACVAVGARLLAPLVPRWWTPPLHRRLALGPPGPDPAARVGTAVALLVAGLVPRWLARVPQVRIDPALARRAGPGTDLAAVRGEQAVWSVVGAAAGAALGVVGASGVRDGAVRVLLATLGAALAGAWARRRVLAAAVARRERLVLHELPVVVELLALSVSAGEGLTGALARVGGTCRGEFAGEIARVVAAVNTGVPLARALGELAAVPGPAAVRRFVDGVAVAVDRGTPLADLLRAQARDARDEARRDLLVEAGRREIAMMVPVVFLVLPVTVVFALFPGLALIDLGR